MPTSAGPSSTNEQDLALARQFFDAQGLAPGPSFIPHPSELARLNHMPSGLATLNHDGWIMEQRKHQPFRPEDMQGIWASEFQASNHIISPSVQHNIAARPDCVFSTSINPSTFSYSDSPSPTKELQSATHEHVWQFDDHAWIIRCPLQQYEFKYCRSKPGEK